MRVTINDLLAMKLRGDKIPMVTAYDYTSGRLADIAGIPLVLVGDSLGMVILGYDNTISVTMSDVIHHTRAVVRATKNSLVVADMPFMTFRIGLSETLHNVRRLIQEGGAHGVKVEGGELVADTVKHIVESGIPVMGHVGLTPQSVHQSGGYFVKGRDLAEANQVMRDVQALQDAGVFAIVLELVPASLARIITHRVSVPTIGIGAGPYCDGQIQVLHDMLGLYTDFVPKHTKRYLKLAENIQQALEEYAEDVRNGVFPSDAQSYEMDESVLEKLRDSFSS